MSSHQGVREQNSLMVDAKSKNLLCTDGHLKNDNYPCSTLKKVKICQNHFRISGNCFIYGMG